MASALDPHNVVITGSHGVGKRSFLSYVFYRLRQLSSPPTIVIDTPGGFACVGTDETIRLGDRGVSFQSELAERTTIYLCDAASDTGMSPLLVRAKSLAVVSPSHDRQDGFTRDTQCITFTMPAWSSAELDACRKVCYPHVSREQLTQRQELWGGLVRWALAEPLAVANAQFARSVAQLTLDRAALLVGTGAYMENEQGDIGEAQYLIVMYAEENSTFLLREASLCSARACAALVGTAPSSDHFVRFLQTHRASFALRGLLQQIEDQLLRHLLAV